MKPEQFIREYGVERAREVVEGAPDEASAIIGAIYLKFTDRHFWSWHGGKHKGNPEKYFYYKDRSVDLSDLKRLVESLDIISDLDGIDAAKGTLAELIKLDWDEFEHRWIDNWMCTRPRLEQAIRDHESIYGGGDE